MFFFILIHKILLKPKNFQKNNHLSLIRKCRYNLKMIYTIVIIGVASAYLRGRIENDLKSELVFIQTSTNTPTDDLKSQVAELVSSEQTQIRDFSQHCTKFIEKYQTERNKLAEIISSTELQVSSLLKVDVLLSKHKQITTQLEEFNNKLQQDTQNGIKQDSATSERVNLSSENIAELKKAIEYLTKIVSSDPAHIKDLLDHIVLIKNNYESELLMEKNYKSQESSSTYGLVIEDLLNEKAQIEQKIENIQNENQRLEKYLLTIKPQLESINAVILSKTNQCRAKENVLKNIESLSESIKNI